jgi:hypothetical protein
MVEPIHPCSNLRFDMDITVASTHIWPSRSGAPGPAARRGTRARLSEGLPHRPWWGELTPYSPMHGSIPLVKRALEVFVAAVGRWGRHTTASSPEERLASPRCLLVLAVLTNYD